MAGMKEELIASCGMNCRLCYGYIRPPSKYHMSMIGNLAVIRSAGMPSFLRQQEEAYRCSVCGATVCVHRDECPSCNASAWEAER